MRGWKKHRAVAREQARTGKNPALYCPKCGAFTPIAGVPHDCKPDIQHRGKNGGKPK